MTDHVSRSDEQSRLAAALGNAYTLERPLGHGGMATVYLARDVKHERPVAIKVLRPELYSRSFSERFLAEITVTAGLQHPHILPLFDSGAVDELLYYVMPYVSGGTLREKLRATPQLPIDEAVRIATEVAGALEYAHSQGIVHRDIKPENILLQDGSALVADFGIAFSIASGAGERLTGTGLAIGTPAYMSPEQASGERALDARSDVYALGAVLYEMLAGVTPHTGDSAGQLLAKVLTTDPEPLPTKRTDVSRALAAVIAKALARRAHDRWPSAAAFAASLDSPPAVVMPATPARTTRAWRRYAIAASVLAIGGVAAWWQLTRVAPPPVVTSRRQVTFVGTVQSVSLTPDGRTLAYVATSDDSLSIYTQDLSGGNALRLTTLPSADINSLHWSPDGSRLLLAGSSGTSTIALVIPALGGSSRQLPVTTMVRSMLPFAVWHEDGTQAALWGPAADPSLAIIDLTSGDTTSRALKGVGFLFSGQLSRHSNRLIAFHALAESSQTFGPAIIPPTGSPSFVLGSSVEDSILAMPQWGPHDDAIYALRNHGNSELVRVPLRRDGVTAAGPPQVLASDLQHWRSRMHGSIAGLSLSADATRLAYTRETRYATIESVPSVGPPIALTKNTTKKWSATPSPDGSRVAYLQSTTGNQVDLWMLDVASGSTRQITFDTPLAAVDGVPTLAWSPSGDRLVVIAIENGERRLALIDPTGRSPITTLQSAAPNEHSGLVWAPAARVVYEDFLFGRGIHLLDPDTGRDSVVLAGDSTVMRYMATMTRDGESIAYYQTGADSTSTGLYVVDRDGSPRRVATQWLTPIGWSEDETTIVVWEGGTRNILGVSLDGTSRKLAQTSRFNDLCQLPRARGVSGFVCTSITSVSDAWLLELKHPP